MLKSDNYLVNFLYQVLVLFAWLMIISQFTAQPAISVIFALCAVVVYQTKTPKLAFIRDVIFFLALVTPLAIALSGYLTVGLSGVTLGQMLMAGYNNVWVYVTMAITTVAVGYSYYKRLIR